MAGIKKLRSGSSPSKDSGESNVACQVYYSQDKQGVVALTYNSQKAVERHNPKEK